MRHACPAAGAARARYSCLSSCEAQASAWASRPWATPSSSSSSSSSSNSGGSSSSSSSSRGTVSDKAPHEADAEDHHQQQRQGQQQEGPRGRAALLRALASARSYQRALLKMMRRLDLAAQRCDARRRAAWADAQNVAEKERDQRDRERARRACSTSSARRAVWGIPDTPESARAAGITPQQFQCYQEAKLDLRDGAPAGAVVDADAPPAAANGDGGVVFPVHFFDDALGFNAAMHRVDGTGVRVIGTVPGGTAARAGVSPGDTIWGVLTGGGGGGGGGGACDGMRAPFYAAESAPFAATIERLQRAKRPTTVLFRRRRRPAAIILAHAASHHEVASGRGGATALHARGRDMPSRQVLATAQRTEQACERCGTFAATFRCSRCRAVSYCGWKCQRADWKARHRFACCGQKSAAVAAATNGPITASDSLPASLEPLAKRPRGAFAQQGVAASGEGVWPSSFKLKWTPARDAVLIRAMNAVGDPGEKGEAVSAATTPATTSWKGIGAWCVAAAPRLFTLPADVPAKTGAGARRPLDKTKLARSCFWRWRQTLKARAMGSAKRGGRWTAEEDALLCLAVCAYVLLTHP